MLWIIYAVIVLGVFGWLYRLDRNDQKAAEFRKRNRQAAHQVTVARMPELEARG
jgi:hypothetical protein